MLQIRNMISFLVCLLFTECLLAVENTCSYDIFQQLETLRCYAKNLKNFPRDISDSTQFLIFAQNEIEEIPTNLSEVLPRLVKIDLSKNRISRLHSNIFSNLKNLSSVYLLNNVIGAIDDNIFRGVETLRFGLNLQYNRISAIHKDAFAGLYADATIDLSSNNISNLHEDLLQDLRGLETLKLDYNKISTLSSRVFRNQEKLYYLSLRGNQITELDENLFRGLTSLESLILNENNLTSVPDKLFSQKSLRSISFESNLLSYPPINIPPDAHILLKNNPIICDCKLKDMLLNPDFKSKIKDIDQITCFNYKGLPIEDAMTELDCRPSTTSTTRIVTRNKTRTTKSIHVTRVLKTNKTIIHIEESSSKTNTTLILSVILAVLVLIVVVAVFVYLYRRNIATKIVEVTTLPRKKKRRNNNRLNADDFYHYENDGWEGSKTAMYSKTECDV